MAVRLTEQPHVHDFIARNNSRKRIGYISVRMPCTYLYYFYLKVTHLFEPIYRIRQIPHVKTARP
jgi:hypothetical protein